MKHILRLPTKSNLHPQKIALKVRRDGPQPSIFVRSFSAITSFDPVDESGDLALTPGVRERGGPLVCRTAR